MRGRLAIGLEIGALVMASFAASPASAKPAACEVRVGGFQSYRGPCDVASERGGSFRMSRPRTQLLTPVRGAGWDEQDSAYVRVVAPDVALLFGIGGAHQTGTYLATLHRRGACWVSARPADTFNGDASVCAR